MKKMMLTITLKSDLCAGSGYAFSGLIDTDVCFDELGIPYIPARRLKGCFRETSEFLEEKGFFNGGTTDKIFGRSGESAQGGVTIENAYIEDYADIRSAIKKTMEDHKPVITPQSILECFTSVKAQTRLEEGVAEENTLRYTRVVDQYILFDPCETGNNKQQPQENVSGLCQEPLQYKELTFKTDVYLDDDVCEDDVIDVVRGTRNIGMDRNRGLGSVVCSITSENNRTTQTDPAFETDNTLQDDKRYIIKYKIKNKEPLMISNGDDGVSEAYIPGQSVLGAFAAKWLKKGNRADTSEFMDLFLNGATEYSFLYPCKEDDSDDHKEFFAAPSFVNKLKKTGKIINILKKDGRNDEDEKKDLEDGYDPVYADASKKISGNMPKKLKKEYISLAEDGGVIKICGMIKPQMQIDFHHSKKGDEDVFYSNEVLKEGQFFSGSIITKGKYVNEILSILDDGHGFRFGKSKSAQYGKCEVINRYVPEEKTEKPDDYNGDYVIVLFTSDAIFTDENDYTVDYRKISEQVAESIGLKTDGCTYYKSWDDMSADDKKKYYSFLNTRQIFGYNAKWNLHRPPTPAVAAGSALIYKLKDINSTIKLKEKKVGERKHEGFGRIKIFSCDKFKYRVEELEEKPNKSQNPEEDSHYLADIFADRIIEKSIIDESVKKNIGIEISPSTLGRLTLMLEESIKKVDDWWKKWVEFIKRIDSIKRKKEKSEIVGYLKKTICTNTEIIKHNNNDMLIEEKDEYGNVMDIKKLSLPKGCSVRDKQVFINKNWYKLLKKNLTILKYDKKIGEKVEATKGGVG